MSISIEEVAQNAIILFEYVSNPNLDMSYCRQWRVFVDEAGILAGRESLADMAVALEQAYEKLTQQEKEKLSDIGCWDIEILEMVLRLEGGLWELSPTGTMFHQPMAEGTAYRILKQIIREGSNEPFIDGGEV